MKFEKLLISLAIFAISMNAVHGMDILSPAQLGEPMNMPLSQDLLQKSIKAGVIDSDTQVAGSSPSGSSGFNLGTPMTSNAIGDSDSQPTSGEKMLNANANGALSLILQDKAINYLNLELHQSGASILGQGKLIAGNSVQNVKASGLVENGKLSLTIAPDESSDVYTLELQPEGNALKGSYRVNSADKAPLSGTAIGIFFNEVRQQSPQILPPESSDIATGATKPLSSGGVPLQLGTGSSIGSTFSSSKSISMSGGYGGSMVSSTSSSSS